MTQLENDLLNGPPVDYGGESTNPPSVEMSDDVNDGATESSMFHYETDPFNLNSLQSNQKQGIFKVYPLIKVSLIRNLFV